MNGTFCKKSRLSIEQIKKMKEIVLRIILSICFITASVLSAAAQTNIYRSESGSITFRSEAPLEIITASSNELKGIIDHDAQTFAFVVPITSFKGFNNGLQQQHFYENYLESSKYPEATFSGKIIEDIDLTQPGTYHVRAKGQLNIHGRTQERIIKTELISDGTRITARSEFIIPLSDHQIEVPRIVFQKIAQEIKVNVRTTLSLSGKS
jgi:polyisoprenoid-binding protein YceI